MYRVQLLDEVAEAVEVLPRTCLPDFAELRAALELSPWSVGACYVPTNPTGLRVVDLGDPPRGAAVFGVIERDRLVTIVQLTVF